MVEIGAINKNVLLSINKLDIEINELNSVIPSNIKTESDVTTSLDSRGIISTDDKYTSVVSYYNDKFTERNTRKIEKSKKLILIYAISKYIDYTDANDTTPTAIQLKAELEEGTEEEKAYAVDYLTANLGLTEETT